MTPRSLYLVATGSWFTAFGLQNVVFAWLVTIVLHERAELVGLAQTALLAPGMLLILIAGALADRVGPDRQALYAQIGGALVPWILIGALAMGWLSYGVMVLYAIVMGVIQAFITPARDGLLNHVAGTKVQQTVLMTSLTQFGCQIFGYTVAGYADRVGAEVILMVQSAIGVVGVVAFVAIRRADLVEKTNVRHSVWSGVASGAITVWSSAVMRVVVVQNVAMACFFMGCFIVCFPLVVREVFQGSSSDLSWLNSFNSLGLVTTILIMLRVGYVRRPGRAVLLYQGLGAVVLAAAGLMENFVLFVAAVFVWGLCGGVAMPMSRTLMQELAPPEQRARVMSFYAFSFMGAGPLGTLLCGYLAGAYGPQMAIVLCGSAMLLVVAVIRLSSKLWYAEFDGDGQRI